MNILLSNHIAEFVSALAPTGAVIHIPDNAKRQKPMVADNVRIVPGEVLTDIKVAADYLRRNKISVVYAQGRQAMDFFAAARGLLGKDQTVNIIVTGHTGYVWCVWWKSLVFLLMARIKYEQQTKNGTSVVQVLIRGRAEAFCGLYAALDNPIWGFGPWAEDKNEYWARFLEKFGSQEDAVEYYKYKLYEAQKGRSLVGMLPCHSMIMQFWVWYGIFGLLYWLYVLWAFFRYFRRELDTVPQWFGYLAGGMPAILWNVFFSPFGNRVMYTTFVVAILMVHAIRKGSVRLPASMLYDVNNSERRR